ncbi:MULTISPECIES: Rgg/GadR/MutR family transcriptional regulator [unclassified Enterococcus]|uniref:Rgg/GadR/MutR family transcriptional regulator n=1 Tax=unclassified Enterococcus TaxID=2608891 RepID=UPI0013EB8384|nr:MULTISPECIES: Rgg/GadR/MutR family transcriptional regulator [unclassified Enterococcus]
MEVWEIIEYVRKQKGMSVAELCGEEVSRSVYERFVKNHADTTVSKLTYFLQRLNMGYEELRIFNYPPDTSSRKQMMKEMDLAFMSRDTNELQRIIELCEAKENMTQKEKHLVSLCKLLIARLMQEEIDVTEYEVYQYLIDAQTWTHYELILFNNCMYAFDPIFIDLLLDKALLSITMYQTSQEGKRETFRMLVNAIIHFIQNHQRGLVWKYISKLKEVHLEEDLFFERNLLLFLNGIWEMIKGNKKGQSKVKQALAICRQLGAHHHYKMNYELIQCVEEMYALDFELEESDIVK